MDTFSRNDNPCLSCGACCVTFRVSFYWAEANARGLPLEMTEQVNQLMNCMAGTDRASPRCTALRGDIGKDVACTIYDKRPSPCRELEPGEDKCNGARVRHGMDAIEPATTRQNNDAV